MIGRWSETPPEVDTEKPKGFDDFELLLGDIMRGERATMGKSLLDVQRELKIKATYIAAIENTDPTAFETPGFIAGYVRSYARYLGMDPEWAYGRFCTEGNFETSHGMSPAASGVSLTRDEKKISKPKVRDPLADPNAIFVPRGEAVMSRIQPGALGSVAVLVALIGALGYGGWSVLQQIQRVQFTPVDQAPGVASTLDPALPGGTLIAASDVTPAIEPPSVETMDRLYRPEALDVPVLVARDGPIAAIDPRTLGNLVPDPRDVAVAEANPQQIFPHDTDAPVQVVAADVPEVVLLAVRPSWVRVQAADGSVIFEKILDAGERYVLPKTEEPPLLRAGNAGSVYFAVNGEAYGPAGTGPSVVKNVALSPEALRENYTVADMDADDDLAKMVNVAEVVVPPVSE